MLKDNGFMATITVGSAMSSGGTLKAALEQLGLPNCMGGNLQVTPVSGISNLTVNCVVSSNGTAYIKGTAGGSVTSGAVGTYFLQVANGAKVTLT